MALMFCAEHSALIRVVKHTKAIMLNNSLIAIYLFYMFFNLL